MKHALLLPVLGIVLLSSCATAFKSGQTPDDVYFSPGNEAGVVREEQAKKQDEAQYQDYVSSLDDRYLRMKVANRYRWGAIDNFDYWYDSRYDFNSYNTYSSYNYYNTLNPYANLNPFWGTSFGYGYRGGWNSPYATVISYANPSYGKGGGGSTSGSNISAYRNKSYDNTNYGFKDPKTGNIVPGGSSNSSFGNLLKRVFSSSETTSSYDRPARTFNNTPTPSNTPTQPTPAPATSSSAGG
ncbi:MAG: hypothetical protein ABIS69_12125, partial [Sediminibacterium sp.]